jgi:transcriptional regulator with XRE-family HTH domain
MEKESILKDRLRSLLDYYGIGVKELVEKIGGSRATYFNILNGSSQPDFKTTMAILNGFPEMSAEWWTRGAGPMLKTDILSKEEAESILAENRAIKAMYRAELLGKDKGATLNSPEETIKKTDKIFRNELAKTAIRNVRRGGRKSIVVSPGRVQGASFPNMLELFKI